MNKKFFRYRYLVVLSLIFITVSCLNTDDCPGTCYTPPAPFTLKIVDGSGNNLINHLTYTPDSIYLYTVHDNDSMEITIYFEEIYDGYILTSSDLPWDMMKDNNPTFYLYLNSSDTDTLTIEVVQKSDECCIWHSYETYQYNAVDMTIDMGSYAFLGVK